MTKIHHFLNLVVWDAVNEEIRNKKTDTVKDILYCDSWSMLLMMKAFDFSGQRNPGTQFLQKLSSTIDVKFLILSSGMEIIESYAIIQTLPKNVIPGNFLMPELDENIDTVIIGISSPKQNLIARQIAIANPHIKDVYCLGAAVDLILSKRKIKDPNLLSFIFFYPRRTIIKILQSIKSALSILFLAKARHEFNEFIRLPEWK